MSFADTCGKIGYSKCHCIPWNVDIQSYVEMGKADIVDSNPITDTRATCIKFSNSDAKINSSVKKSTWRRTGWPILYMYKTLEMRKG